MGESKHISGLTRGLNLRRTSNKIAAYGTVLALIVYVARSVCEQWVVGNPMTVLEALSSSLVVFVAWAVARELDPDHPWPAAVSMLASFIVALWFVPAALVVAVASAAVRMISGTVGRSFTVVDLGIMLIVGLGSGRELASWSIAILAFVFLKTAPEVGRLRWWAIGSLTAGFVAGWYGGELSPIIVTTATAAATGGFLVVAGIAASRTKVSVRTDARTGPIERKRLAMSRLAAGVIMASATLLGGFDAMWEIAPVGVALGVVAVVSLIPVVAGPTSDGLKPRTTSAETAS